MRIVEFEVGDVIWGVIVVFFFFILYDGCFLIVLMLILLYFGLKLWFEFI